MEIHMENQVKNGKSNGKAAAQTVVILGLHREYFSGRIMENHHEKAH